MVGQGGSKGGVDERCDHGHKPSRSPINAFGDALAVANHTSYLLGY